MGKIIIFSFFSGSGFLDLGFEKSDMEIEFVNEFSDSFLRAYMFSRKSMEMRTPKYGYHKTDINEYLNDREVELREYIDDARNKNECLIGFIGGPPCPDFSVAGKNKGKDGDNGKLSLTYINLIEKIKPDFFLFENVKGLWRTARHRVFYEELKRSLHKSGYATSEQLINSLEFGVPQDRDRIFMFGINKTIIHKGLYEDSEILRFPWNNHKKYTLDEVGKADWPDRDKFTEDSIRSKPSKIIQELTVQYYFDKNDVENHPNANASFKPRAGLNRMMSVCEGDVSKKSYKRLHRWRYSPTAAYGNNEVHLHPFQCRRISASEALAIQSLPKEFELPQDMSLTDMFKTIGNGVPFLLSKGIAETIKDFLEVSICKD